MTPNELGKLCVDAINSPHSSAGGKIVLHAPTRGGLFPKGGGPRAKVLGSQSGKNGNIEYILMYDAMHVLAALVAAGHIQIAEGAPDVRN